MKKVFCKNCKYDKGLRCGHYTQKTNLYTGDNEEMTSTEIQEKWKDINKNGECPYYKQKWWKFWIKK